MAPASFRYHVDRDDRICSVSDEWLAFARQNGAPELDRDRVLGTELWKFVDDEETRYIYRLIFDAARTQRRLFKVPFRCDSPDVRRYMEILVSPGSDDVIALTGLLIREEPRQNVALLDAGVPRTNRFQTICGWCKRVRVSSGRWVGVEQAIQDLRLFDTSPLPQLTHGICDVCRSKISAQLKSAV